MCLLPQGGFLRTPRPNALVPLAIGLVFLVVGVWVVRMTAAPVHQPRL
jgi:hypothetical protein